MCIYQFFFYISVLLLFCFVFMFFAFVVVVVVFFLEKPTHFLRCQYQLEEGQNLLALATKRCFNPICEKLHCKLNLFIN